MTLLLTAFAAVLYVLGWLAGKVSLVAAWCWTALAVGWDDARSRPDDRTPVRT